MTDDLHRLTRKRLAAMARRRHVSGWHEMRKADLIEALKAQPDENDPSAFPATFPVQSETNGHGSTSPNGNGSGRRPAARPPLLVTGDRDDDRFAARPVSPHWIRAEWTLSKNTLRRTESALGVARHRAEPVLRLYDVSSDERLTHAVTFVSDTEIAADAHEWFVQVDRPGGVYQLQLGIRTRDGEFHRLISSDRVETGEPLSTPVSPVARQPSPESICRNGSQSPVRTTTIPLRAEAELVIRGATHPKAVLAVANESIPLQSDGMFEHTRPLTDGRHVIPTTALSPDGRRQHTIVFAIECHTKHLTPLASDEE